MNTTIEFFEVSKGVQALVTEASTGATDLFETTDVKPIKAKGSKQLVPWGEDNQKPWEILEKLGKSVVMSPNTYFNVLVGYGQGIDITQKGKEEPDEEIKDFFDDNVIDQYLLEQLNDMKPFFFTVTELILSNDKQKITDINHLENVFVRFEKMSSSGKIENIYYANWKDNLAEKDITAIPLLDPKRPFKDLQERVAKGKVDKVAMLNRFPLPGRTYYPIPPYAAAFESGWYDIAQLIPIGKKAKFEKGIRLQYIIEIHQEYFPKLFNEEKISDPEKQVARKKKEFENIKNFLSGMQNAGKAWFSTYYVDALGKEQSMVRITNLEGNKKEGGDWIADSEEASNMLCYAQGVHPNLNGATPGKSGSNMSGTDKRELFTMKQALEKPFRDLLLRPIKLVARFNGWKDLSITIPDLMLTTLDKGTDAKKVSQTTETK